MASAAIPSASRRCCAASHGTSAPRRRSPRIAADAAEAGTSVSDDTVAEYLSALTRLMVVEDQPAWNTHLRSGTLLRSTPTRHFV